MKQLFGYHVTRKANLESIKKQGLEPRTPSDYGLEGDYECVYLFKTKDDLENAIYNWFGDRIEEWEEKNDEEFGEIVLKIDLTGLENQLIDSVEYEWSCFVRIGPERIVETFEI